MDKPSQPVCVPSQLLTVGELERGCTRTGVNYLAQSYTPDLELLAWTDGKTVRLIPARFQRRDGTTCRTGHSAHVDAGFILDHPHELRLEDADAMHHLAWARQVEKDRAFFCCAGARALQVWEVTVASGPSFEVRASLLTRISVDNEDSSASASGKEQRGNGVGRPQPHPIRGLCWCPAVAHVPLLAVARTSDVRLFELRRTQPTPTHTVSTADPTETAMGTATATAAATIVAPGKPKLELLEVLELPTSLCPPVSCCWDTASHASDAGGGAGIENGEMCLCVCGRAELCIFRWPVAAGSATFGETGSGAAASRTRHAFLPGGSLRGVLPLPATRSGTDSSVGPVFVCATERCLALGVGGSGVPTAGRGGALGLGRGLGLGLELGASAATPSAAAVVAVAGAVAPPRPINDWLSAVPRRPPPHKSLSVTACSKLGPATSSGSPDATAPVAQKSDNDKASDELAEVEELTSEVCDGDGVVDLTSLRPTSSSTSLASSMLRIDGLCDNADASPVVLDLQGRNGDGGGGSTASHSSSGLLLGGSSEASETDHMLQDADANAAQLKLITLRTVETTADVHLDHPVLASKPNSRSKPATCTGPAASTATSMYGRAVFLTPEPVLDPDPDPEPEPEPEPEWTHVDRRICCIGSAKCCTRIRNVQRSMGADESDDANHSAKNMGDKLGTTTTAETGHVEVSLPDLMASVYDAESGTHLLAVGSHSCPHVLLCAVSLPVAGTDADGGACTGPASPLIRVVGTLELPTGRRPQGMCHIPFIGTRDPTTQAKADAPVGALVILVKSAPPVRGADAGTVTGGGHPGRQRGRWHPSQHVRGGGRKDCLELCVFPVHTLRSKLRHALPTPPPARALSAVAPQLPAADTQPRQPKNEQPACSSASWLRQPQPELATNWGQFMGRAKAKPKLAPADPVPAPAPRMSLAEPRSHATVLMSARPQVDGRSSAGSGAQIEAEQRARVAGRQTATISGEATANVLAWRAWRAQQMSTASLAAAVTPHSELGDNTSVACAAAAAATPEMPSSQKEMLMAILENQRHILAQLAELRSGMEGSDMRIGNIERRLATLSLQPSSKAL